MTAFTRSVADSVALLDRILVVRDVNQPGDSAGLTDRPPVVVKSSTNVSQPVADSLGVTERLLVTRSAYQPGESVEVIESLRITGNRYQPGDSVGLTALPPTVVKAGSARVLADVMGLGDAGRAVRTVETTSSVVLVLDNQIVVKIFASTGIGRPKVNLGTGWESKPAKVYIGGSWVEKPLKRYNGTTWVPVS